MFQCSGTKMCSFSLAWYQITFCWCVAVIDRSHTLRALHSHSSASNKHPNQRADPWDGPKSPHVALSQEEEVPWRMLRNVSLQVFPFGCTVPNCWDCGKCKPSEIWGRSWKLQRPPCCQRVPRSLCCLGWGNTTQRSSGGKNLPFKLTSDWGRSEPDLTPF